MEYKDTEPAGGSRKNRLADTVIRLEPGKLRRRLRHRRFPRLP